jgi:DNA-binding transcriptional regulator YhcF (GntR family)
MKKRTFEIAREVYFILKKEKELSVKQIADKTGSQWETVIRSLEFFKEIGIAKEREGKKTYKKERLFSLV